MEILWILWSEFNDLQKSISCYETGVVFNDLTTKKCLTPFSRTGIFWTKKRNSSWCGGFDCCAMCSRCICMYHTSYPQGNSAAVMLCNTVDVDCAYQRKRQVVWMLLSVLEFKNEVPIWSTSFALRVYYYTIKAVVSFQITNSHSDSRTVKEG